MTVIGFDLDMTLIDSRPGIGATLRRIAAESGHAIDVELATSRLGPPLGWELAHWMPDDQVDRWVDRYRELYPRPRDRRGRGLPGAHAADRERPTRAAARWSSRPSTRPNVQLHVDHLGLEVGEVFGGAWREQKAEVLLASRAPRCTSATTSTTWSPPASPASSASGSPPAAPRAEELRDGRRRRRDRLAAGVRDALAHLP